MLSLLCYNIYFGKKLSYILSWIAKISKKPDIICFQEFPQSKIGEVKAFLKIYEADFTVNIRKKHGAYGQLTLYNPKRVMFKDTATLQLGATRIEKLLHRTFHQRTALSTTFFYKSNTFSIINCHLTPITINRRRRKQLESILDRIDGNPAVILGDYNYSSLFQRKKLLALMRKQGFENATKRMRTHKLFFLHHQLDYIFYKNIVVKDVKVQKVTFSDHYPIFASIFV